MTPTFYQAILESPQWQEWEQSIQMSHLNLREILAIDENPAGYVQAFFDHLVRKALYAHVTLYVPDVSPNNDFHARNVLEGYLRSKGVPLAQEYTTTGQPMHVVFTQSIRIGR